MVKRLVCLVPVIAVCLAAAPEVGPLASGGTNLPRPVLSKKTLSAAEFEQLLQTDPIAALEASLARFERDTKGYHCTLVKQETLSGKLGGVEVIRHAVREEPFAAYLFWEQGAGSAKATLYRAGDGGTMHVRTGLGTLSLNPAMGKSSARYSIEDAGLFNGTLRTYTAWKTARDEGTLKVEYKGRRMVPELGRECFVLHRVCDGLAVDNFRMADTTRRDPAKFPKEAFASVTAYFDCETWAQTGSVLKKADGSLFAAYWFKDVKVNPTFSPEQFTPSALK